tara:strand:+ start:631 stop:930 length:300 start_codon:yes stop_codon:yes gene_type:complete
MATFRKFKNHFKGNVGLDIWINVDHIITVYESISSETDTNSIQPTVTLYSESGQSWLVDDSIDEVVEKLNGSETLQDGMSKHFRRSVKAKKSVDDLKKL